MRMYDICVFSDKRYKPDEVRVGLLYTIRYLEFRTWDEFHANV